MPGDLTPTEESIVEGIAGGLYDAEIAVRLGLSIGDVKERTTHILQRHHLVDRPALVEWYRLQIEGPPSPPLSMPRPPLRLRPWFVPALMAVSFLAGLVFALAFTWPGGDRVAGDGAPPALETATHDVEIIIQTPEPLPSQGSLTSPPLLRGNAVTIDEGFAPIAINYRDGGSLGATLPTILERLYLDPASGLVETEEIWREPQNSNFLVAVPNDLGTLIAVAYDSDAGRWLDRVTVGGDLIHRESITQRQLPLAWAGEELVMYDAGDTYIDVDSIPVQPESLLGWTPQTGMLFLSTGGEVVNSPRSAFDETSFQLASDRTRAERILGFGLLRDDGLATGVRTGSTTLSGVPDVIRVDGGIALVAWVSGEDEFTSLIALQNGGIVEQTRFGAFRAVGAASGLRFIGYACEPGAASGCYGRPAVYSLVDGRVSELAGFGNRSLIGSQRGPFARVVAPSTSNPAGGACEPVFADLAARGQPLFCAGQGEPLTLADMSAVEIYYPRDPRIESSGGADYVRVLTPFGEPGWIRMEAVEVSPSPAPPE